MQARHHQGQVITDASFPFIIPSTFFVHKCISVLKVIFSSMRKSFSLHSYFIRIFQLHFKLQACRKANWRIDINITQKNPTDLLLLMDPRHVLLAGESKQPPRRHRAKHVHRLKKSIYIKHRSKPFTLPIAYRAKQS